MISEKVYFDSLGFDEEKRQYKVMANALCEIAKAYNELEPNTFNEAIARVVLSGNAEELRTHYVDSQTKRDGKHRLMAKMLEQSANTEFNAFAMFVSKYKEKCWVWQNLDLSLLSFKGELIVFTGEEKLRLGFTKQATTDRQKRFIELVEQIEIARDELLNMLPNNVPLIGYGGVFEIDRQDLSYNSSLVEFI